MEVLNPWDFSKDFRLDSNVKKLSISGPISREKIHNVTFSYDGNILCCPNFTLELNLEIAEISKIQKSYKYNYADSIVFALQILFRLGIKKCFCKDFEKISTYYLQFGFYPIIQNNIAANEIQNILIRLNKISWKEFEKYELDEEMKVIHFANKNYQYIASPFHYICKTKESLAKWLKILKEGGPGYTDLARLFTLMNECKLVNPIIILQEIE